MKNKIEVLPKEFMISAKYNNNPLWEKYIKWLNTNYSNPYSENKSLSGYINNAYYGVSNNKSMCYIHYNIHPDIPELSIYQWYAAINNVPDFTVEGTKLPDMSNSNYCTTSHTYFNNFGLLNSDLIHTPFYSIDIITINNEVCVTADKLLYTDDNYFVFKLKDIIKRYKQENQMERKEVVGYKIKEKYVDAYIRLFSITYKTRDELLNSKTSFLSDTESCSMVDNLNLLDIWFDKVYKENIKLPTINGYSGEYDKENHIIIYGCARIYVPYINTVYNAIIAFNTNNNNIDVANRTIKSITLSSDVTISLQQLREIVEYIDNM